MKTITKKQLDDLVTQQTESIVTLVNDNQNGSKRWKKTTGQTLVYGFESALGFGASCDLCAICEYNFKKPDVMKEKISTLLYAVVDEHTGITVEG